MIILQIVYGIQLYNDQIYTGIFWSNININKKSRDYKERQVDRTSLSAGSVPVILFVKNFPNRPECKSSRLVNINKE